MTDLLAQIAVWLALPANALGGFRLAPVAWLPGWLSATLIAAATGVLLLVVFKYTSNQRAIKRVRDDVQAHLLAVRLFRDSTWVTVCAQGRILLGAFRMVALAIVPMLVMTVPVCLLLGQLALWYQSRPFRVGEEAVVTVTLRGSADSSWPEVRIEPTSAAEVLVGPVRVFSKREVCWSIRACAAGYHRVRFRVGDETAEKDLAIGEGLMRLSAKRPDRSWSEILTHPGEQPFSSSSAIRSIEIDYPDRPSWTSGTDCWIVYWFAASMVAALCFRRVVNVQF